MLLQRQSRKLSERKWLRQQLTPLKLVDSVRAHRESFKYVRGPQTVTTWNVMAAIRSHLGAAASGPPLQLPLDQDMWRKRRGSNEAAVTLFIQMVTGCVSLSLTAA